MLTKKITYTDYNGVEQTDTFYFNLSKADVIEMDLEIPGGMKALLDNIVEAQDGKQIMEVFKKIILRAYGQKSADGKRFIKNKELSEEFSQTEAYSELFVELVSDADKAVAFLSGVLPTMTAEQQAEVDKEVQKKLEEYKITVTDEETVVEKKAE